MQQSSAGGSHLKPGHCMRKPALLTPCSCDSLLAHEKVRPLGALCEIERLEATIRKLAVPRTPVTIMILIIIIFVKCNSLEDCVREVKGGKDSKFGNCQIFLKLLFKDLTVLHFRQLSRRILWDDFSRHSQPKPELAPKMHARDVVENALGLS